LHVLDLVSDVAGRPGAKALRGLRRFVSAFPRGLFKLDVGKPKRLDVRAYGRLESLGKQSRERGAPRCLPCSLHPGRGGIAFGFGDRLHA